MPPRLSAKRTTPDTLARLDAEQQADVLQAFALRKRTATSKYSQFQRELAFDPVTFATRCLDWPDGEGLASYQGEILTAMYRHGRAAYRGPHGVGKSTLKSIALLHFALTRDGIGGDWKVPTTASVWMQLERYLWPEVHKWIERLKWEAIGRPPFKRGTELLDLALKLSTGEAFAVASSESERIEGAHADHLLYIFDEAKIIPDATFDSAEGAFSNADPPRTEAYALCGSTPGEPVGRFYAIHARKPGTEHWWVRHVTLDEAIAARRVTRTWADQQAALWGPHSATYQNRVLGEFCLDEAVGLIPLAWVNAAIARWHDWQANGAYRDSFTGLGCDISDGGQDLTVFAPRFGRVITELVTYTPGQLVDVMDTTGRILAYVRPYGGTAIVDGIGIGAGVVARLQEQERDEGITVLSFIASRRSVTFDRTGQFHFANLRSEAWWRLRELLDPTNPQDEQLALPPDDQLVADLTAPTWRLLSNGRIQVEPKSAIQERLKRSPDKGDAVAMVFMLADVDVATAYGLSPCPTCGELYERPRSWPDRPCPYCAGTAVRFRPPPLRRIAVG